MAAPDFPLINHVFVLMLENHSFDHLLGFSGIKGADAVTRKPTQINGPGGMENNTFENKGYPVQQPAPHSMPIDPGHEFTDTLEQLTGSTQPYDPGKGYPEITSSGFAQNYARHLTPGGTDYGEIMECFGPEQLPVLNALAREFVVCDNWFSSLPGPTWPNRFFVHAGSSGGLDHSPTTGEILAWENIGGMNFQHGTVFDQLREKFDSPYRLYRGNNFLSDSFPNVAALKGINALDCHSIADFPADIAGEYDWPYTFIEPSYGDVLNNTYRGGTSQHPLDDARGGEKLIKLVYETIRNSAIWEKSLLIVLWDEHGGFYDHVAPPAAVVPGDGVASPGINQYGFDFSRYGVRVPAVIASPLISKNTIDHRLYDHASVPRTLQELFSLSPMTNRDREASSLFSLLLLEERPRTDCVTTLPAPAVSAMAMTAPDEVAGIAIPANHGSLPGFLHAALKTDLDLSPPAEHKAIKAQFAAIHTQKDARAYMDKVMLKMQNQADHK